MPALPTHAAFQPPTTLELDRTWSLGGQIGSGGFARVYVVTSPDIPPHVAKFVPKDPGAARELRIPDLTNSLPNVVPVVDRGQWNNHWILIMPKAQSSLADLISGNPGPVAASHVEMILADLAQALVAIKDHIVHRDIKPSNILLLNGKWCLADFGIARYAEHTTATQTWKHARSAPYAAPEQWQDKRTTPATDVYSLGVVAYHLLAGEPPFGGPKIHDYRQQHLVQQPPRLKGAPTHLATTIDECLAKPPESRPTAKQVLSRLKQGARPQSEAARRLAEANHRFVRKRGESETRRAAAELEKEHMELLVVAATGSLIRIVESLDNDIQVSAPACTIQRDRMPAWRATLGRATIRVAPVSSGSHEFNGRVNATWKVVAYSSISLQLPRDRYGHEGRSHSLWYACQGSESAYRWYELAFRIHPLIPKSTSVSPFSRPPHDQEAQHALSPGMHPIDLEVPPVPIDQGGESAFVERWINHFAGAAG